MKGFECAEENEGCNCTGMVEYGIYDVEQKMYSVLPMKEVDGFIECKEENFGDMQEDLKWKKTCRCFPISSFLHSIRLVFPVYPYLQIQSVQ